MASKTRRIKIESIEITPEFLRRLGTIIEKETKQIEKLSKNKINRLIKEKNEEMKKELKWCTDKNTRTRLQRSAEESIKYVNKPNYIIVYTIKADNEDLSFSSIEELLSLNVFPQKIKSISFRISHYDSNNVDISFSLDNDYDSIAKLSLTSNNESKLLKIEKDLKDLFREYKTRYAWIYKIPGSKYFILQILSFIIPFSGIFLFIKFIKYIFPILNKDSIIEIAFICLIGLFWLFNFLLKYLYPYYLFELSKNNLKNSIKAIVWVFILGFIGNLIYDIVRYFI